MQVGQYGKYQGVWYICVADRGNRILIIDENGGKRQISPKNFVVREGNVARTVHYEGCKYLITKSKKIINLLTNKYMRWHDTHPVRNNILNLRGIEQCKQALKTFNQFDLPL